MPSISPIDTLRSSEISVGASLHDEGFVEDGCQESSRSHHSNSPHTPNSVESGEVPKECGNNATRVDSPLQIESGPSVSHREFWLPPEPQDQEDDLIGSVSNYDDDDEEWAKPSSLSVSDKFEEEKVKAMNDVKEGKFRALVLQLIKSVGVDLVSEWLDIVTCLSWEAAAFVKPDVHEGKAMDPDGHVKVKCVATGTKNQSQVIKGLVFKKHAAHKHMQTKYKNPRLLLINGSLDLSSGGLSSFKSMEQENGTLNSIIEMIDMHHPNVILVEKSVSRDIQEKILAKGITLVFDMKLHRLERVARCIGSPILSSEVAIGQKFRQCDSFHIEKFVEELAASAEGGKKQSKTLMFLEGSPTRLGCTILLMGANSDELKRIKYVVRCAVIMAYHLMLETSFLLDQSAMFSTISPSEIVSLALTNEESTPGDSHEETISSPVASFTRDIPISNGSGQHHNLISNSIQKVMEDIFPLFSDPENDIQISNGDGPEEDNLLNNDSADEIHSKDEINSVLNSESILVLMSSRNPSRESICEQSHFSHIKFYRSFDVPLGKFLRDDLLNQRTQCKTCNDPPEAHFFYYAHHNKQLTIRVKRLPAEKNLPGETEGKLWMWSRCGQCKFDDETLKSTKRVLISSGALGLSFGKYLELSFSNQSSFTNPSKCGHAFHKDFLFFFGLGPMVAMFRYSPVATYSVSLPPQKMEFSSSIRGDFLEKDYENVYSTGFSMFHDIEKSLKDIEARYAGVTLNIMGSSKEFTDILEMLKQEKSQFKSDVENVIKNEGEDFPICKLLSLNRVRLELLLDSYIWDQRLHALNSSDLKMVDTKPIDSQAPESLTKDDEIPVKNCDNTSGSEFREIPIDGEVKENNPEENYENNHSVEVEINSQLENFDQSVELQKDKTNVHVPSNQENDKNWIWAPSFDIRREYMEDLHKGYLPKFESFSSHNSESMARKLIRDEGSKLHIPINDYFVSDYEDELSSIIACALALLKDQDLPSEVLEGSTQGIPRAQSLNSPRWSSFGSLDSSDGTQSTVTSSFEDSHSSSFDGLDLLDSLVSFGANHPEVSMGSGKVPGRKRYAVTCLYAGQFRQLRDRCCPSEVEYIASLSRCKNWDAKGGKSKSFFAKTLDDRFIIKEIKRTEFDSFMKFAPIYFDYMNQCFELGNQTCLAKILGIYQVVIRATKHGKEIRHDILVMENLSFGRHIARQYDLKGALHARLATSSNEEGDVLLDQNFVNDMNVSPLYVSRKSKRNLQRAVYNDTNFLNSINVMDYSLLVGVDAKSRELVCGIIDYLRQYTWDKQLENWVKSSLVVPKNTLPTIISPKEYKKRFRKFMDTYFLSVPDHWCSQRSNPCKLCGPSEKNGSFI